MAKKKNNFSFNNFLSQLESSKITSSKEVENKEERKYFLIVCEGERTEPQYFNYFKTLLPRNLLDTIEISGEGDNTVNIVKKALKLKQEREKNVLLPNYDEVWAIYDKDDFPNNRYHEAIELAERNAISSGHSNQSFELWYVLHFEYLQSALHRSDYIKILSKKLGFKYEKKDTKVVEYLFNNCDVNQAIKWAEMLEKMHDNIRPSEACPSTQVHKLVKLLLAYCTKE